MKKELYNEQYYKTNNYADYLEREERYFHLAKELSETLDKFSLVSKRSTIVDFGCAVGHLLLGFKQLGYKRIFGVEISKWARLQASKKKLKVVTDIKKIKKIDILLCLDVLEHIQYNDLAAIVSNFPDIVVIRVPVAAIKDGDFYYKVSRLDKTHITCLTKQQWKEYFSSFGYQTCLELNLSTIYNSKGVFSAVFLKNNNNFLVTDL